ncbi:MAG: hypothetical protein ACK5PS_01200 [Desulfopila sp.]
MTDRHPISRYLNRQTLIAGDVNAGKTTLTARIVAQLTEAGYGTQLAILDLAPSQIQGVGGKLSGSVDGSILYLTTEIAAPRLMGRDLAHTVELARQNARKIEQLFRQLARQPRPVLVVNDATLYLQQGSLSRLNDILTTSPTRIINAYYGASFAVSELSRRERALTEAIIATSDQVIML